MRIAILGTGFAGLAAAWHLLVQSKASISVDLFDPLPFRQNASGISSGLLHTFTGKKAEKVAEAERLIVHAHTLITAAASTMNRSLVLSNGILRPAIGSKQIEEFQKRASEESECQWWTRKECEKRIPGLQLEPEGGSLFIKNGLTIDVEGYLEGLLQAVIRLGGNYIRRTLAGIEEMALYDRIIMAVGANISNFRLLEKLPYSLVKGQVLEISWPDLPPLSHSLVGPCHIVMQKGGKRCIVGATFERDFKTNEVDLAATAGELIPKVQSFFPSLANSKILGCKSAVRVCSATHLPLVGKLIEKYWLISAFGAKGLLYHGACAFHLARALLGDNPALIPEPIRTPFLTPPS